MKNKKSSKFNPLIAASALAMYMSDDAFGIPKVKLFKVGSCAKGGLPKLKKKKSGNHFVYSVKKSKKENS